MTRKLFISLILLFVSAPNIVSLSNYAFAQSVDTAWVRRYNGPANSDDRALAMAVDGSGNIYVTGGSYSGETNYDYATIKYYPNGDTAWVRRYNGPRDSLDFASAIVVDDFANVCVIGIGNGSGTRGEYATIKYLPNGDTAWVRRFEGPVDFEDWAPSIAVDDFGNVCVAGNTITAGTGDYVIIKYYPNGDTAWIRTYNGSGNGWDEATAIAVDEFGNIYITGESFGSGTERDYATVKYYPNGDTAWIRRYSGPGDHHDYGRAIAVDVSGNVYVTGTSYDTVTYSDYATIKYDSSGNELWVRRYNGSGNVTNWATAMVLDGFGSLYVTGISYAIEPPGNCGFTTVKYDPAGNELWVGTYFTLDLAIATAIAIDDFGSTYVTGTEVRFSAFPNYIDYRTVKYDTLGNKIWRVRYNGSGDSADGASAIGVDDFGNVYVTGESYGSGTGYDYATIKYVQFLRGDANGDGAINSADVVYLINYLFVGGPAPVPIQAGDANRDGVVNSADVVYLINYLFIGGPAPCA